MRVSQALSTFLFAVILASLTLLANLGPAAAHAGHGHTGEVIAKQAPAAVHERSWIELRAPDNGGSPVAPCTSGCCTAGMGCCAALMVFPIEFKALFEGRRVREASSTGGVGIEPDVPLKPPRFAA